VALATQGALAPVITADPPFSVVFTPIFFFECCASDCLRGS
jgi:hypothetical protein